MKIYEKAIEKWGDKQIIVAMEEMAELIKELSKHLRGRENKKEITEEIADVEIMIEQLKLMFGIEREVKKEKKNKIKGLREMVR